MTRHGRQNAAMLAESTFEEARAQFPVLERVAYLNAGSMGPLARATVEAMRAELDRDFTYGRSGKTYIDRVFELRDLLRSGLGALVGADPEQVALTGSTTDGCNIVIAGLDLAPRDEIVTTSDEHFGLIGPAHTSGAHVVVAPPEPEAIVAAVTPRTRLVALSHVLWTTGRVLPVRDLREATGLPILVDGAQSVGAIPVTADGIDFLTISGQKWLCGPDSTGGLVVADPERLRVARPSYWSQESHEPDGSFVPWPDARRFEHMWLSAASLAGLLAALDVRPSWSYEHAAATAELCRTLLRDAGLDVVVPDEGATLVSWRVADERPADVVQRLAERDVIVRELPRTDLVRASIGWWTSEEDLRRLVDGAVA